MIRSAFWATLPLVLSGSLVATGASHSSRLSDEAKPLQTEDFPERPAPLFEIGNKFLSKGNIKDGFVLPTGAVWAPSFFVYGNFRSAVQTFDNGTTRVSEFSNDLNLFGNLRLSPTERILIGVAPFRSNDGEFTGYTWEPNAQEGYNENFGTNWEPATLFFEGEFGELFPRLDDNDRRSLDYGISAGRQPLRLQDGLLLEDDRIDAITITRNALLPGGGSHLKISGLFAWNEIQRGDNLIDHSAKIYGMSMFIDLPKTTIEGDILYVTSDDDEDGFYAGIGGTQRIGKYATTFRINQSVAVDDETPGVGTGTLLFAEVAYTPAHTHNNLYVNGYYSINDFTSAARGPFSGGPIGRAGIMFAAVGLGQYGSPLNNRATRSVGGALGYQMFFGEYRRRQLIVETGGLASTDGAGSAQALGARYQQAYGRRTIFIADLFGAAQESMDDAFGARFEVLVKF